MANNATEVGETIVEIKSVDGDVIFQAKFVDDVIDICGVSLSRASLKDTYLNGAEFSSVSFAEADMRMVRMESCNLSECDFIRADLSDACFADTIFHRSRITFSNLQRTSFEGNGDLAAARICECDLSHSNIEAALVRQAGYDAATIFPSEFDPAARGMTLLPSQDKESEFEPTSALEWSTECSELTIKSSSGATLYYARHSPGMLNLSGVVLDDGFLDRMDFEGCIVYGILFRFASCRESDFYWAHIDRCDFTGANLEKAEFQGAMISNTCFSCATLKGANFGSDNLGGGATLCSCDFRDCNIGEAVVVGAIYDSDTLFPRSFDPKSYGMIHVDFISKMNAE